MSVKHSGIDFFFFFFSALMSEPSPTGHQSTALKRQERATKLRAPNKMSLI